MFMSPMYNEKERDESKDILAGNLFERKLTNEGYNSLMQTLSLKPKKKHLKKLLAHMERKDKAFKENQVAFIFKICMQEGWPILLG